MVLPMLLDIFRGWAKDKSPSLKLLNVTSEITTHEFVNGTRIADPSSKVFHKSPHCFGHILVWESQQFEMVVLHIETEELIYWKYHEKIDCNTNLNVITSDYFKVLQTGLRI